MLPGVICVVGHKLHYQEYFVLAGVICVIGSKLCYQK